MPISYNYDSDLNAVIVRPTGVIVLDDVRGYVGQLVQDEDLRSGWVEIFDYDKADDLVLSYRDIRDVAYMIGELVEAKEHGGTCLHASADYAYGIARMYQSAAESHGAKADVYRDWEEMMTAIREREPQGRG
jgi:hypothetical protein